MTKQYDGTMYFTHSGMMIPSAAPNNSPVPTVDKYAIRDSEYQQRKDSVNGLNKTKIQMRYNPLENVNERGKPPIKNVATPNETDMMTMVTRPDMITRIRVFLQ